MNTALRIFVMFSPLIALGGCASHAHQLLADEAGRRLIGSFTHDGSSKPSMTIELNGKRFEDGDFAIHRTQKLAEPRKRYGSDSKHYQRIAAGLDTDHYTYTAEPRPRASDGAMLRCSLAWRPGQSPAGTCETEDGERTGVMAQ